MTQYIIAIDLGGTTSKLALVDPQGNLLDKWSLITDTKEHGQWILPNIARSIQEALERNELSLDDILGIGMGCPGRSDQVTGCVSGAFNLNWHANYPVKEFFDQYFPLNFYIDNDANLAALGEYWLGAGQDCDPMILLTLGTGVGAGIIINGTSFRGYRGSAGEIGHLMVDPDHRFECSCGKKGCLETIASVNGLANLTYYHQDSMSDVTIEANNGLLATQVIDLARQGHDGALVIMNEFAQALSLALSHLLNILNPERILLGGGLSRASDLLIPIMNECIHQYTFVNNREYTLRVAELGNDAGVYGAVKMVLDQQENRK